MSASLHHPEYDDMAPTWVRNRDAVAGQRAIIAKFETYFPPFVPSQPERYARVKGIARFLSTAGDAVTDHTGAAFNIKPQVELPESIKYMEGDADGSGNTLEQTAKQTVANTIAVGRHGLLTDYPATAGQNMSMADVQRLGLRASIKQYPAESGINWGVTDSGSLSYVVLREQRELSSNTFFQHDCEDVYRVYWMQDGRCRTTVLEEGQDLDPESGEEVRDANSVAFDEIPFVFVGAMDNRPSVDKPPITGLVDSNIAHFQTTCSHVENVQKLGQVTVGIDIGDINYTEFLLANGMQQGDAIAIGADSGYIFGQGGKFTMATAPETTLAVTDIELLEKQMQGQGANLMDKRSGAMTATEANIDAKQRVSQMVNSVNNTSSALVQCLNWAERMMSKTPVGTSEYVIDTTFDGEGYDPETGNTILAAVDRGIVSAGEARPYFERIPGLELAETGADDAAEGR